MVEAASPVPGGAVRSIRPLGFVTRRPALHCALLSASLWTLIIGLGYGSAQLAGAVLVGAEFEDEGGSGSDRVLADLPPAAEAKSDRLARIIDTLGPLGGILLSIDYAQRLGSIDPFVSAAMTPPVFAAPQHDLARLALRRPAPSPAPRQAAAAPAPGTWQEGLRAELADLLRSLGLTASSSRLALDDVALDGISGGDAQAASAAGSPGAPAAQPEEERDRQLDALNRVLVDTGGLLLPPWTVEIQPEARYSYKGANGLLIVERDGVRQVMAQDADTNQLEAAVTARLGLPWSSQAEIRVPYLYATENTSFGGQSESTSVSGLGDIDLALSHQLMWESRYLPDLLAQIYWKTNSGKDAFDGDDRNLPLGTGFHGVGGRLTAVKTYDPVVFQSTVGYTRNFEGTKQGFDIDPGDSFYVGVGSVLAAGPGVALRTGMTMNFTSAATVDGNKIDGSEKTEGVLSVGTSITLPDNVLLDVSAGIGVTDDAPDVALRAALAYRF